MPWLTKMDIFLYYTFPYFFPNKLAGLQIYKYLFTSRVERSVDPDQLASQKPADQDQHSFQNSIYRGLAL